MAAQVALETTLVHFNNVSVSLLKSQHLQLLDSENIGIYMQQMAKLDTNEFSSGNGEGARILSPEQGFHFLKAPRKGDIAGRQREHVLPACRRGLGILYSLYTGSLWHVAGSPPGIIFYVF